MPRRVLRERKARRAAPFRVKLDKILRDVLDGRLCARFRLVPFRAAHARKTGRFPLGADIFLQELHLIGRHEKLVVAAVFDMKIIAFDAARLQRLDTEIFADAVRDMNHIIADADFPEMRDFRAVRRFRRTQFLLLPPEDVPFGNDDKLRVRQLKASGQDALRHRRRPLGKFVGIRHDHRRHAALRQKLTQGRRFRAVAQKDQHALTAAKPIPHVRNEKVDLPLIRRDGFRHDADDLRRLRSVYLLQDQRGVHHVAGRRLRKQLLP